MLGGWGHARARQVKGLGVPVRPRRARRRQCLVSHVLLPVTAVLRRGYAAQVVWESLWLRGRGRGHRRIAGQLRVSAATVRGWLRRAGGRLEEIRAWFLKVAVRIGMDVTIPEGGLRLE